jgi:4-amino-4-deoxy-L-arabinose transferase-like glycosyltransferase
VVTILVVAGALRGLWLTADPASSTSTNAGVVWHDEGAWVHNARNQALWGVWRTDEWNPMFIAPVFTGLEAAAFNVFGVGTWQARTVPAASGLVAILALMWGLGSIAGRRAALVGGVLLATSYTFVMWNRAALMESTMTMFIVVGWAAYARAFRQPQWGVLAGVAVVLAFFTKAAAAFFVGAILLELATTAILAIRDKGNSSFSAASATVLGLAVAAVAALALFVIPYWSDFQFYNWVMTVERKPEYTLAAFMRNASWLPLTHGVFMRMWPVLLVAAVAAVSIVARWRSAHPAERLAVLWLLVGLVEVVVHDSGNQRRYVMFVPALIALASLRLAPIQYVGRRFGGANDGAVEATPYRSSPWARPAAVLTVAFLGYLVFGSALRLVWLDQIMANDYRTTVRVSAALAVVLAASVWWKWQTWARMLTGASLPIRAAAAVVVIACGIDLALFGRWAGERTFLNYDASRALGAMLPSRTLVHGKLANGLALENHIAPLFIGKGFGNHADRLERNDARYILTYTQPALGHEGEVILDVLRHYPGQRIVVEFDVAASEVDRTAGHDRAALIDKFPDGPEPRARHQ